MFSLNAIAAAVLSWSAYPGPRGADSKPGIISSVPATPQPRRAIGLPTPADSDYPNRTAARLAGIVIGNSTQFGASAWLVACYGLRSYWTEFKPGIAGAALRLVRRHEGPVPVLTQSIGATVSLSGSQKEARP